MSKLTINPRLAALVSIILDTEGYAAFWTRSETGRVSVTTNAPKEVIDNALALANVGA